MAARKLRAVDSPASASTVKDAAASADPRELLVALRDRIAGDIDEGVPPRDLAALSRRLLEISRDIAALDDSRSEDRVGQAAAEPDVPWSG